MTTRSDLSGRIRIDDTDLRTWTASLMLAEGETKSVPRMQMGAAQ